MIEDFTKLSTDKLRQKISEKRIDQMTSEAEKTARLNLVNFIRNSTEIDDYKVVFLGFSGNYDCNIKYICEYFLKKFPFYKIVWGTFEHNNLKDEDNFPSNVKVLVRESYDFYKELSSAKYVFDNSINMISIGYEKKPGQILVETWHGAMGIKMFGPLGNKDTEWHKLAFKEASMTDYIVSNSRLENEVYRKTFWKDNRILKIGHARNDIFFLRKKEKNEIKNRICSRYQIPNTSHICLYAPTFRDDYNLDVYMLEGNALKKALIERFGGDWVILCKYHDGIVRTYWDKIVMPHDVINASDYPDIQELSLIADVGITDYSSWIFEYLLTKKPGFIFAKDYKSYVKNERKLLFPLEETPFPLATSEDDLYKNICDFDNIVFRKRVSKYLSKHGNVDKGKASKKIVDYLLKNKA